MINKLINLVFIGVLGLTFLPILYDASLTAQEVEEQFLVLDIYNQSPSGTVTLTNEQVDFFQRASVGEVIDFKITLEHPILSPIKTDYYLIYNGKLPSGSTGHLRDHFFNTPGNTFSNFPFLDQKETIFYWEVLFYPNYPFFINGNTLTYNFFNFASNLGDVFDKNGNVIQFPTSAFTGATVADFTTTTMSVKYVKDNLTYAIPVSIALLLTISYVSYLGLKKGE